MAEKMQEKYKQYLAVIGASLEKFFENQRAYIFCKEGCSHCCKRGQYPYTKVEFEYLMSGFERLEPQIKDMILEKINEIKAAQKKWEKEGKGEIFRHVCPFLVDEKCSLYHYRGLICRVFGLSWFGKDGTINVPSCIDDGLNYSNVFDKEKKCFSAEMFEKSGFDTEPLAYNVSLKTLLQNDGVQYLGLEFGDTKPLIDWL